MQLQKVERREVNVQSEAASPVVKTLRDCAVFIMDAADRLYDWISSAVEDLSRGSASAEEAGDEEEVVEEATNEEAPAQEDEGGE